MVGAKSEEEYGEHGLDDLDDPDEFGQLEDVFAGHVFGLPMRIRTVRGFSRSLAETFVETEKGIDEQSNNLR